MNFKKYFLAIFVGLGFLACSDDNDVEQDPQGPEGVPTYINLSVNLSSSLGQKALPEDYNPDGDYEGNDGVVTLDIYMVADDGTLEAKRFVGSDISSTGTVVAPSQPFRTTSGTKTVWVVLNSPQPLQTTVPTDDDWLPMAGLAKIQSDGGVNYDVITMTGKSIPTYIAPDITAQGVSGGANTVKVQVTRVASRVIVTTTASTDLMAEDGTTKIGTISNITYSVAQGTNQIYRTGRTQLDAATNSLYPLTWGSDYIPVTGNYNTQATKYYDYADLLTPAAVPAKPATDGYKSLPGKFLFENGHKLGDVKTSGYKKGNTAYVLVRATLTPDPTAVADGQPLVNNTFYVGQTDGLIYSSKAAAQAAVQNQKVAMYQNGKMLQYAWLNPDDIEKPENSPVMRNNIYHINIKAFNKIGLNWNPLYPEDPNLPDNPDTKPGDPDEPENPIDPTDPLTPEQTYMSVDITVLNWTVHSYDIEF